jgi:hypothetical protein
MIIIRTKSYLEKLEAAKKDRGSRSSMSSREFASLLIDFGFFDSGLGSGDHFVYKHNLSNQAITFPHRASVHKNAIRDLMNALNSMAGENFITAYELEQCKNKAIKKKNIDLFHQLLNEKSKQDIPNVEKSKDWRDYQKLNY